MGLLLALYLLGARGTALQMAQEGGALPLGQRSIQKALEADATAYAAVEEEYGGPGPLNSADELQAWCLERLAYFKVPGYVAFVDALPVTATNKVQKARLADFASNPLASPDCFDLREHKKLALRQAA